MVDKVQKSWKNGLELEKKIEKASNVQKVGKW